MGIHTGKDGVVKAGAGPTAIASVTNWSITDEIGVVESKAMGNTYVQQLPTLRKWGGSIAVELDHADAGQDLLETGDLIAVELYSETDAVGKKYFSGNALVVTKDIATPSDGMVTLTATIAGSGALAKQTVV